MFVLFTDRIHDFDDFYEACTESLVEDFWKYDYKYTAMQLTALSYQRRFKNVGYREDIVVRMHYAIPRKIKHFFL